MNKEAVKKRKICSNHFFTAPFNILKNCYSMLLYNYDYYNLDYIK